MISAFGPLLGLLIALLLMVWKTPPVLGLVIGAALGGLIGGGEALRVGEEMLRGSWEMVPAAVCVLSSGLLAGALIRTGSAERLARTVLHSVGRRWAVLAIAGCVMLLTAAGVFVDIAVLTAAPVALAIGRKTGLRRSAVLLAMIGGGKAGNIISPNPNTIAAAKAFELELTEVIASNLLPALCALAGTVLMVSLFPTEKKDCVLDEECVSLPPLWASLSGPVTVLALLGLRPVCGVELDPAKALLLGGVVCMVCCRSVSRAGEIVRFGVSEVWGVVLLLLGTGTLAGVISASNLQLEAAKMLENNAFPPLLLAPLSGILMGGAAASTTAGTAIASRTFGPVLLNAGISACSSAAMIHAGATVLDSLPHGSFFHATAGCAELSVKERLKLIPVEALIGLISTAAATILSLFV